MIGGVPVEAIREEWLVEDRWWTLDPLRRHYFEVVLTTGRNLVIFRTPSQGKPPHARTRSGGHAGHWSWFSQRA